MLAQALRSTSGLALDRKADVGISTERDTDRQWVTGHALTLELPIFDQRQADVAQTEARFARARSGWRLSRKYSIRGALIAGRLMMQRHTVEQCKEVSSSPAERTRSFNASKYN